MSQKQRTRWFWSVFLFLTLITISVISEALIFSPLRFDPRPLDHFETEMNGSKQENLLWANDGNLKDLEKVIDQEWTRSGWKPVAQGMDLAPSLLGLMKAPGVLSPYLQLKAFEKGPVLRTLGLMQDSQGDQTYGWVSETPKDILDLKVARAHWDFPFSPPENAQRLICQKNQNFVMAIIAIPTTPNLPMAFSRLYSAQGFQSRQFQGTYDHPGYLLCKGSIRLLVLLDSAPTEDVISLTYFKKN